MGAPMGNDNARGPHKKGWYKGSGGKKYLHGVKFGQNREIIKRHQTLGGSPIRVFSAKARNLAKRRALRSIDKVNLMSKFISIQSRYHKP